MNKQTKIIILVVLGVLYIVFKPNITTSSSADKKKKLSCADDEIYQGGTCVKKHSSK